MSAAKAVAVLLVGAGVFIAAIVGVVAVAQPQLVENSQYLLDLEHGSVDVSAEQQGQFCEVAVEIDTVPEDSKFTVWLGMGDRMRYYSTLERGQPATELDLEYGQAVYVLTTGDFMGSVAYEATETCELVAVDG